jgi:eukaryotic-like serine/threonine-protein kinase
MLPSGTEQRFEIRERLGSGSFGIVYEAFDHYRNRSVALKVLERASADAVARFKREFRNLAEVRHPNLASLYELLVVGDHWILSMELIRGTELLEHLAIAELQNSLVQLRTPADLEKTLKLRRTPKKSAVSAVYINQVRETFRQLAVAITVLHEHGIVHRDIKPSNIMITPEGRVVLLDFGLAVAIAADDSIDRQTVVGTPGYMSPEQISASAPSTASDWYAFGVLLFQALTGRMPFVAPTPLDVMELQVRGEPARASEAVPALPDDLASLADDCISRDPEARPPDAKVLQRLGVRQHDPIGIKRKRARRPDCIGRRREVRTLRSWIASGQKGEPRVILLHGSPGSGKSALLDLLLDQIRAEADALIVSGRCQAWESVRFNAVDSVVDSLARELRREHRPDVDRRLNRAVAVTQLFPALIPARSADTGEETITVPPKGDRLIAKAVGELRSILSAAAGDRSILIVLDDAQWGDYQSAQILLRLLQSEKVTLLLSYRTEDWRTSLLLQALLSSAMPTREFRLRDLSRAMTAQMVKSATGRTNQRLASAVFRQTKGNPALIEMAVDAIFGDPKNHRSLIARAASLRIERLSASARQLFQFLLARDGPIDDALAAKALELFESDEPLRSLRRERLIRVRKTGDLQEIDVYHPRIREALAPGRFGSGDVQHRGDRFLGSGIVEAANAHEDRHGVRQPG